MYQHGVTSHGDDMDLAWHLCFQENESHSKWWLSGEIDTNWKWKDERA